MPFGYDADTLTDDAENDEGISNDDHGPNPRIKRQIEKPDQNQPQQRQAPAETASQRPTAATPSAREELAKANEPVGGSAIQASKSRPPTISAQPSEKNVASGINKIGQNFGQGILNNIKNSQAAAQKLIRVVGSARKLLTLANPWTLAIIGIILLVLIVAGGIAYFGTMMGKANQPVQAGGGTLLQPTNPIADQDFLVKFLALANDGDIKKRKIAEMSDKIQKGINELESELNKDESKNYPKINEIQQKISEIKNMLKQLADPNNTAKTEIANKIVAKINEMGNLATAVIEPFIGNKSLPFGNGIEPNLAKGIGLHFNTRWLKDNANGHRTYQFFGPKYNIGDAADFFISTSTPILAVMDGKIEEYNSSVYFLNGKDNNGHSYKVTYAHIRLDLEQGITKDNIRAGKRIGYARKNHLHFEVTKDGKPINYQYIDLYDNKCGGLVYYDIGEKSGNFGSKYGSKKCKNSDGPTMASLFWEYTKTIFKP